MIIENIENNSNTFRDKEYVEFEFLHKDLSTRYIILTKLLENVFNIFQIVLRKSKLELCAK